MLVVRDFEKCLSFYRDKLGFKLENREEDFAYLTFGSQSGPGLALTSVDSAVKLISEAQIRPKEKTIHRNYFAVFLKDVDREYEELKAKGVHFVKPPTTFPWGQRIAYFEDPEGNLWEISHFIKK
jgi:catechol 2,3-dioxygenase-like lactoylglutathione lyase family enzyme